jgi:hypothetical protein
MLLQKEEGSISFMILEIRGVERAASTFEMLNDMILERVERIAVVAPDHHPLVLPQARW